MSKLYYKYNITSSSDIFTTIQTFLTTIGFTVIESSPTSASKSVLMKDLNNKYFILIEEETDSSIIRGVKIKLFEYSTSYNVSASYSSQIGAFEETPYHYLCFKRTGTDDLLIDKEGSGLIYCNNVGNTVLITLSESNYTKKSMSIFFGTPEIYVNKDTDIKCVAYIGHISDIDEEFPSHKMMYPKISLIASIDYMKSEIYNNYVSDTEYNILTTDLITTFDFLKPDNLPLYGSFVNALKVYRCKTGHRSGNTLDKSYWERIGTGAVHIWKQNTYYNVGDIVYYYDVQENLKRNKLSNTVNCMSMILPLIFYIKRAPKGLNTYSAIAHTNKIGFVDMFNMSHDTKREADFPYKHSLYRCYYMVMKRWRLGSLGFAVKQEEVS